MIRVPPERATMGLSYRFSAWKVTLEFLCQFSEKEREKGLVYLEGTHSGSLFWRAWLLLASDQTQCPKQSVSLLDPLPW